MGEGFIKLYSKMLDWEWYDDINTKVVFIHCLLRANWKAGSWHGIDYEAGQFITSLPTLAEETQLSIQQVRTALDHLKSTGEITSKQQAKCRIITVVKWCEYQGDNRQSNRQATGNQQDGNRIATADKDIKDIKEYKDVKDKKNIYGEYGHVRLTDDERNKLMDEYGEAETSEAIKYLDEYIEMKGYKAKSHYLCIKKWVFDAVKREKERSGTKKQNFVDEWRNA